MRRKLVIGFAFLFAQGVIANSPGPHANLYREYPPSCLADPLPSTPSGPSWSKQLTVAARQSANGSGGATENITLTFWRVPCTAGVSAMLGLFQRSAQNEGRSDIVPTMPGIAASSNTGGYTARVRTAAEPNTIRSEIRPGTPLESTTAFVLEQYPVPAPFNLGYSSALLLQFDSGVAGSPPASLEVPAYNPAQYADAQASLPLSGYQSGNWFDFMHSYEGIQTEIGEIDGAQDRGDPDRYLVIAWYAYDAAGRPYWLFGTGTFYSGATLVTVELDYGANGGFAGNSTASAKLTRWGTLQVDFPDCFTMHFTYQADAGLPSTIPQGSGSRLWSRLTQINGMSCQ